MPSLLEYWENELEICECNASCDCGAYLNLPDIKDVQLLLDLKNVNTINIYSDELHFDKR